MYAIKCFCQENGVLQVLYIKVQEGAINHTSINVVLVSTASYKIFSVATTELLKYHLQRYKESLVTCAKVHLDQ